MIYAFEETGETRNPVRGENFLNLGGRVDLSYSHVGGTYSILRPIPQAEIEAALAKIKAKDFGIERSKS